MRRSHSLPNNVTLYHLIHEENRDNSPLNTSTSPKPKLNTTAHEEEKLNEHHHQNRPVNLNTLHPLTFDEHMKSLKHRWSSFHLCMAWFKGTTQESTGSAKYDSTSKRERERENSMDNHHLIQTSSVPTSLDPLNIDEHMKRQGTLL